MKEVERRFLVKNVDFINLSKYEKKEIEQFYLYRDKIVTVRKRKLTLSNGETHFFHTVKSNFFRRNCIRLWLSSTILAFTSKPGFI